MTDEQIRQNAEKYADQFISRCFCGEWKDVVLYFTAGAHSRDEEIKELKEEIESLKENEKELFDGFKKRGTKLGELMKENVKLRNPWISVENRLPEEDKDVFVRKICTNGIFYLVGKVLNGGKWYCYGFGWQDADAITHWMPIPELKKGDK